MICEQGGMATDQLGESNFELIQDAERQAQSLGNFPFPKGNHQPFMLGLRADASGQDRTCCKRLELLWHTSLAQRLDLGQIEQLVQACQLPRWTGLLQQLQSALWTALPEMQVPMSCA